MAGDSKLGGLGAASGTGDASTWLDIQSLGHLRAGANAHRADTVRQVAQQFESMFLGMMLKSMRDAKLADSPFDSDESRLYQDMYDKQVSLGLSQGKGLGIADMLVRQLDPQGAAKAKDVEGASAAGAARRGAPNGHAPTGVGAAASTGGTAAPGTTASGVLARIATARASASFDAGSIGRHDGFRAARRTEAAAAGGVVAAAAPGASAGDFALRADAVPPAFAAELDGLDAALGGDPSDGGGEYRIDPARFVALSRATVDAVATAPPASVAAAPGAGTDAKAVASVDRAVAASEPAHRTHGARRFADSPEDFVRKVLPHARAAAAELGVSPDAIVAQAALETGWGRNVPASAGGAGHNLFGIKAGAEWGGARVGRTTLEVSAGIPVRTQAAFRAYDTVADGFRDYVNLLGTSSRYGGVRGAGADHARFAHALQSGGYATDPHYARKILAIVNGSTLRDAMAAAVADERNGTLMALKTDAVPPIT